MPTPSRKRRQRADRRRALALLATYPDGMTEALLLAHGFSTELLVELIGAGFATAHAERMAVGPRRLEVVRVRITEAGRQALAGMKR
jgi:hypothetical protein